MSRRTTVQALVVIALSCLVFVGHSPAIVWDMASYVAHGLNLALGHGYVGADLAFSSTLRGTRGPLFPTMIAGALLFERSAEAAFWVVRFFAILAPLALYGLGAVLLGRRAGLVAALLYLSSWAINHASMRHLDAIWPTLALAAVMLVIVAYDRRSLRWSLAAGVFLGLAYLTKEAAIIFLPVPFAAWLVVPEFRTRRVFTLAAICLGASVVTVAPWLVYVYANIGEVPLLGKVGTWLLSLYFDFGTESGENLTPGFLSGLVGIFSGPRNSLFSSFPIGVLFPLTWAYVAVLSLRLNPRARVLLIVLAVSFPIAHFSAIQNFRIGQNMVFYQYAFLCLALTVDDLATRLGSLASFEFTTRSLRAIFIGTLVAVQTFVPNRLGKTNLQFLSGTLVAQAFAIRESRPNVDQFDRRPAAEIVRYLKSIAAAPGAVLVDSPPKAQALYFHLNGERPVHTIPTTVCYPSGKLTRGLGTDKGPPPAPLYYYVSEWRWPPRLHFVFQKAMLTTIARRGISYIVTTGFLDGIESYFQDHPMISRVTPSTASRRDLWTLWRINVDSPEMIAHPAIVLEPSHTFLRELRAANPSRYKAILQMQKACFDGDGGIEWFESWYP